MRFSKYTEEYFLKKDLWMWKKYLLSLVVSIITFTDLSPVFSPGVDGTMPWVFNYFFNGHMKLANGIIFPHGPLAFLLYPLPTGNNYIIALIVHFLLRFSFTSTLFSVFSYRTDNNWLTPFLISFLFCGIFDVQFLLIGIMANCFILNNLFQSHFRIFQAIVICAIIVYIKAVGAILALTMLISFLLYNYFRERSLKKISIGIGTLLLSLLITWLLMFGTITGFANFFYGLFQLSLDNSSAVALYPKNNWLFLFASFILFAVIPFLHKNTKVTFLYLIFILPLFACWKYSISRADIYHYLTLFLLMAFFYFLILAVIKKLRFLTFFLGLLSLGFFYANAANIPDYRDMTVSKSGLNVFRKLISEYDQVTSFYNSISQNNIAINKLDEETLSLIKNQTIDIYPWDYTFIAANNLNWKPRPVIQSYASYTSWLDEQNKTHFESANGPEFLLIETGKGSTDLNGGNFESIDNRYLLNDEPETMVSILNNYRLISKRPRFLLFKKNTRKLLQAEIKKGSAGSKWDEWLDVPKINDGLLRAKVTMKENFWGRLKSFFYKGEEFYVFYLLENKDIIRHRVVPKNLRDGLWINPFIMHPENDLLESPVIKIKFASSNSSLMQEEIGIDWYVTNFANDPGKTPILNPDEIYFFKKAFAIFGKNKKRNDSLIIFSENNFSDEKTGWSKNERQQYTDDNHSPLHSTLLKRDQYSSAFTLVFDSSLTHETNSIELMASVFVKASKWNKAQLVISVEDSTAKNLFWEGISLSDFIVDEAKWNQVVIHKNLSNNLILPKGSLKIFLWNTGDEDVLADDFAIKITAVKP